MIMKKYSLDNIASIYPFGEQSTMYKFKKNARSGSGKFL